MDYLDAHQTARLECLKLLSVTTRGGSPTEYLAAADCMARFIIDGTVPERLTSADRVAVAA